jgi:hypothetical protein
MPSAPTWRTSLPIPTPARRTTSRVARPALAGLAVDGKTLRGSRTGDTEVHLLPAVRHGDQIVVAQRQVAARSNEIPAFTPCCPACTDRRRV